MNDFDGNEELNPEEFAKFLREFLAKQSGLDPEQLAKVAGIPNTPEAVAELQRQLQAALSASDQQTTGGVNWQLATDQARQIARAESKPISDDSRRHITEASSIATLWTNEATTVGELFTEPKLLTRELWVADAIGLFQQLSQPVAQRMASALAETMRSNLPEELRGMGGGASQFMKAAGGALFAMQLGQALGKLSTRVVSGGDVGLPIFAERAALVPQNLDELVRSLEVEQDQAYIYLIVREFAFARLFKQRNWLRDSIVAQVTAYAAEISIDTDGLRNLAEEIDLNDPEALRGALESGALIAERTEEQERALAAIETLLALIEGWVEVVTENATKLLPKSAAIAEAMRRRRATTGPAELTFGTLVGLELRPRRMREAAEMWRQVTAAVGIEQRDEIWAHPDLLPTSQEIDNPGLLIQRLQAQGSSSTMDDEIRKLLEGN